MIDEKKLVDDLLNNYLVKNDGTWNDAMDRAVKLTKTAPKVGEWIPVEDQLPDENCEGLEWFIDEEDGDVMSCDLLVTYISPTEKGRRYVTDAFFFKFDNSFSIDNVIAWQPLPSPYDMRKKVEE